MTIQHLLRTLKLSEHATTIWGRFLVLDIFIAGLRSATVVSKQILSTPNYASLHHLRQNKLTVKHVTYVCTCSV